MTDVKQFYMGILKNILLRVNKAVIITLNSDQINDS